MEKEEAERDKMVELEKKTMDARTEMEVADALDEVRTRNSRRERAGLDGITGVSEEKVDDERERIEKEIEEQARLAFQSGTGERVKRLGEDDEETGVLGKEERDKAAMPPPPTFQRQVKKKKDFGAALGIKKKPSLV